MGRNGRFCRVIVAVSVWHATTNIGAEFQRSILITIGGPWRDCVSVTKDRECLGPAALEELRGGKWQVLCWRIVSGWLTSFRVDRFDSVCPKTNEKGFNSLDPQLEWDTLIVRHFAPLLLVGCYLRFQQKTNCSFRKPGISSRHHSAHERKQKAKSRWIKMLYTRCWQEKASLPSCRPPSTGKRTRPHKTVSSVFVLIDIIALEKTASSHSHISFVQSEVDKEEREKLAEGKYVRKKEIYNRGKKWDPEPLQTWLEMMQLKRQERHKRLDPIDPPPSTPTSAKPQLQVSSLFIPTWWRMETDIDTEEDAPNSVPSASEPSNTDSSIKNEPLSPIIRQFERPQR